MREEIVGEISVCENCLHARESGETGPDRDADVPEPWSAIRFGFSVTLGGEHNEGCPNQDGFIGAECDCGDFGYRTTSCDACDDYHHGDRYRYTLWMATDSTAREEFHRAIEDSRYWREWMTVTDSRAQTIALDRAAEWRRFIADRYAERNRFARWMAAHNVTVS